MNRITLVNPPVVEFDGGHHGMPDLGAHTPLKNREGKPESTLVRMTFDGTNYPGNPSTQEKLKITKNNEAGKPLIARTDHVTTKQCRIAIK